MGIWDYTGRIDRRADDNAKSEGDEVDSNGVSSNANSALKATSTWTGEPLPSDLKRKFEGSLGADLSSVRIHRSAESQTAAKAVGAKAYTLGQDIHFGAGHYNPSSPEGEHLIAHEVAHTVQQQGGIKRLQLKDLAVSQPTDSHEVEADRAADAMVAGKTASVDIAPLGLHRKKEDAKKPAADDTTKKDAKAMRAKVAATVKRLTTSSHQLALLPKQGLKLARDAKSQMVLARDSYKTAYDRFAAVLKEQGEKAAADNYYESLVKDELVKRLAGIMIGPIDALFIEGLPGKLIKKQAGKLIDALAKAGVDAVLPDEEDPGPPPASTANDDYTRALERLEVVEEQMIDATRWNEVVFDVDNAVRDLGEAIADAAADDESSVSKYAPAVGSLADVDAACASADAEVANAMNTMADVMHQATLVRQSDADVERRLWSDWLRIHKPGDVIKKRLIELDLADADGNATATQLLQKYIGATCVITAVETPSIAGACTVRFATDPPDVSQRAQGAGGQLRVGSTAIVTTAFEGGLMIASPTAPPIPEVLCPPGTIVTVVEHLMPRGTVNTPKGELPATSDPMGIAVASGSKVPVLRIENSSVVVDVTKAVGGKPYGQYGMPGVTDDVYFPHDAAVPGKNPIDFNYHPESIVTGVAPLEYYVKDGYHLEAKGTEVTPVKE